MLFQKFNAIYLNVNKHTNESLFKINLKFDWRH